MALNGGKLAGGNPENGRVENDYYATNPIAVKMLFDNCKELVCIGGKYLEPCVGEGHIANEVKRYVDGCSVDAVDLIDRGYDGVVVQDFLHFGTDKRYDVVVSNPPYSLAQEFVEHSLDLCDDHGYVAMFLKVQFLEGKKRERFFSLYPPKYVYVFRNRMATWNNGQSLDPNTGKRWSTTMCHAWFVWEKGYTGEPVVRWL